ncbi:MAG: SAM-dependent methyltransferase [Sulfuritalea sp.]|nr:SAM-dependent methyltransferase [Sulfuritalea sp.]MDP1982348.1 SAM-dependent methyltransferase [Sulfuritalea sp.]
MKPAELPAPSADARAASAALTDLIAAEIAARGGWISFARYMELALYAPGLGYYAGGSRKFGVAGDFLTAPELTPLFGQTLARQVAQILAASSPFVIEAGAGSGKLAADLLPALAALGCLPERYRILELSGELRARQQATLAEQAPQYADRVEWLDELPQRFSGCLIGNELLDAMPTHALRWSDEAGEPAVLEGGVSVTDGRLTMVERPAACALLEAAHALHVEAPYRGEISLAARSWVSELAHRLEQGAMLLIDYGLPRHELYHPQRDGGSLRCHYRHRVHEDPLWFPGLSDITSHVDFTAVAEAGFDVGLEVLGYISQANFLLNCGIGEMLQGQRVGAGGTASADDLRARGAVNVLLSPNEMGELFKVIALGRGVTAPLLGFMRGDRVHAL